ncbi:RagB/SusD family nutrient uptake outer membrane protein [Chitinophaga agrisoli]|uniref:RagB/SusD family nutrient uptake outer membrane protein n=1 Tax=Chitinophaga agrisoli TaxID=2607653 RepID=A0A5B2W1L4_9BACT|nr:RagB/SusD family nutrient uptake outer membrane protein [Chitinophaga agrisoli]KAA2244798.1 RagB/SusD family nutrient uptake outer membrane protein [Chitinophaga agrisoli]
MKKIALYALSLALLSACSKDDNKPKDDNVPTDNTTLEVQVYNATNWNPGAPAGQTEAGVTVQLFTSQANFNSNTVAYTQTTGNDGKAVFTKINAGEYFIVARKGDLDNLLGAVLVSGAYVGFKSDSLYQTTGEIATAPINSLAAPGNFRPDDLNGDGQINNDDKGALPWQTATAKSNATVSRRIIIGRTDNRPFPQFGSKAQVTQVMQSTFASLDKWWQFSLAVDAVYTDDFGCTALPGTAALGNEWCTLNGYTGVVATDPLAEKLWKDGYAVLFQLNRIISYVPAMQSADMTTADKALVVAQAKGLAGFVYQRLITFFGPVPLLNVNDITLPTNATRASLDNSNAFAATLLTDAITGLGTDKTIISAAACRAVLIRIFLAKHQFETVRTYANAILSDNSYNLAGTQELFQNPFNKEVLFKTMSSQTAVFASVFNKGVFAPALRLTEVLFAFAEANVQLGELAAGAAALDQIRDREGLDNVSYTNSTDLMAALLDDWKRNMPLEGVRFGVLAHRGYLLQILTPLGYQSKNALLPVPQSIMVDHPNITQNMGY